MEEEKEVGLKRVGGDIIVIWGREGSKRNQGSIMRKKKCLYLLAD
jgi:hypothetical protein